MFLENSCTFCDGQIILLNIVPLKSFEAKNMQAIYHGDFGKDRQDKQIKSTQIYDKW